MVAKRAESITPFIVMEILEKAHAMEREGVDIIHMEVGEPDFDIPKCVKDAVFQAFDKSDTHYTHSLGKIELREEICRYYKKIYGVIIEPDRIVVTSGTSPAMFLLFSTLLENGDEIIVSNPHYACYPNFINFLGGVPAFVPVYEKNAFQYTPEAIKEKINSKTKGILINSPSNPTGNVLSKSQIKEIADIADANSLYVISDEIYHGLIYSGKDHSILEFTENAFVLNGFSKLFAMTGLRLGYLIAPKQFMRAIQKMHQNFYISANSAIQMGGIAALKNADKDVARMKEIYDKRRQYVVKRIKKMGLGITVEPTGAFYVFANVKHLFDKKQNNLSAGIENPDLKSEIKSQNFKTSDSQISSYKLAFDILEKAHVGVTPGIDFGSNAEGYLRFSYANSMENLKEGLDRLEVYFKNAC
ncbi:MAG: aspartate aminotransferase [Desulfobacteraceae bacterium 4572_19]|nr:MAG: aspartate aminotransferase [Desulfobacteraceae bacterium 4572_19]